MQRQSNVSRAIESRTSDDLNAITASDAANPRRQTRINIRQNSCWNTPIIETPSLAEDVPVDDGLRQQLLDGVDFG